MPKPYTIKIFAPTGSPDEIKIINKMNWTGVCTEVSRDSWSKHKSRSEFAHAGIYLLVGYQEDDDMPTLYIGQGDEIGRRLDSHNKTKDFWERAIAFTSSSSGLNRAHITWLEWALIQRASNLGRCRLENTVTPNEPILTESEKADTTEFLDEMYSILPLVELRIFEKPRLIVQTNSVSQAKTDQDTIIVPAQEDGFREVFLGMGCWYAIRISAGKRTGLKYIAAYQTAPVSAITYFAPIESIEPYGDGGKFRVNFSKPAEKIGPIPFGDAKQGSMQGPRYTSYKKLISVSTVAELVGS